jgi:hypothetical protein
LRFAVYPAEPGSLPGFAGSYQSSVCSFQFRISSHTRLRWELAVGSYQSSVGSWQFAVCSLQFKVSSLLAGVYPQLQQSI